MMAGGITVNAAGTLVVEAARNVATGGILTVGGNSTFRCQRVS